MHLSCSVVRGCKNVHFAVCVSDERRLMDAGSFVSVVAVCGALATLAVAAAIAHYLGLIRLLPAPPATILTTDQLLAMQSSSELSSAHGSPYPYHSSGAAPTCWCLLQCITWCTRLPCSHLHQSCQHLLYNIVHMTGTTPTFFVQI